MPATAPQVPPSNSTKLTAANTATDHLATSPSIQPGPETVAAKRLTDLAAHCGVTIKFGGTYV